jgi:hypothetical protein
MSLPRFGGAFSCGLPQHAIPWSNFTYDPRLGGYQRTLPKVSCRALPPSHATETGTGRIATASENCTITIEPHITGANRLERPLRPVGGSIEPRAAALLGAVAAWQRMSKGKAVPVVKVSGVRRDGEKYRIDIKATLFPSVTLIYATVAAAEEAREHALKAVAKATEAMLTGDI